MNIMYETSKAFENADNYQDRIVAFVDVMGIRNRMKNAESPQELRLFSKLMYMYGNQPFAEDKIQTIMFSDCMYLVADIQYVKQLICLLSNFTYSLLVNRIVKVDISGNGEQVCKNRWDCLKLRGGITYGKVLVLDEQAKKKNALFNSNILLGPSVITAYELESKKAFYPRIIADETFLSLLDTNCFSYDECYLVKDKSDDLYYLDFWRYMFKGANESISFLSECMEYVAKELDEAKKAGNDKLIKQLKWYIEYLKNCNKVK